MTQIIVAFLTGVAGPMLVMLIKAYLDSKKSPHDMITDAVEVGNLLTTKIEHIKEEFNADRVWIAQFHNGGHFYPTGKSIQKFSVFYEVTTPSITSIKGVYQNILVSLFNKPLAELYDKGEILVADIETDPTYGLETFCVDNKYKSCYLLSLTDLDGRIIGVMGIYYIHKKHKIVKDEWIFVRQKIGAIGNIMSNYLHSKK
jgi:GAF domain-containing protein